MARLTRQQVEKIIDVAFNSLGEVWYEPWEWNDLTNLPEGFDMWTGDAVEAYMEKLQARAVNAVLEAQGSPGCIEWTPEE